MSNNIKLCSLTNSFSQHKQWLKINTECACMFMYFNINKIIQTSTGSMGKGDVGCWYGPAQHPPPLTSRHILDPPHLALFSSLTQTTSFSRFHFPLFSTNKILTSISKHFHNKCSTDVNGHPLWPRWLSPGLPLPLLPHCLRSHPHPLYHQF